MRIFQTRWTKVKVNADHPSGRPQTGPVQEAERAAALFGVGRALIEAKNASAAFDHAERLIEEYPRRAEGFYLKAEALAGQQRVTEALAVLRAALEADGLNPMLLRLARNLAFRHGGIEEAAEYALKLSQVTSNDLKNELYVTDWFLTSGKIDAALERADALTRAFPDSAQASMRKARALAKKGRAEEALVVLRNALRDAPKNQKLLTLARELAFGEESFREAKTYAVRLLELAPEDEKNRSFLIQTCLIAGEFEEALAHATDLLERSPGDARGVIFKAQALLALQQVPAALAALREAAESHGQDRRLLRLVRSVAFQNGRFDEAADYASRVILLEPADQRNKVFLAQCYMAAGRFDEVEHFFSSAGAERGAVKQEQRYYEDFKELLVSAPALASAWQLALENSVDRKPAQATEGPALDVPVIQYWSQGEPPEDVQLVCANWRNLVERERLGRVELFDRKSALEWIRSNAPEFVTQFSAAFHYAMESDIFRIAYASRRPCVYVDIDSWPLEHTASILRFAIEKTATMLYFRAHRPTIANGFFVSTPQSPFFKKLVQECLAIDLSSMPKNYVTLEATFGPTRYGKVFTDLVRSSGAASASMVEEVPGCSVVPLDGSNVYFAHEAAIASVRPPFPLGYKATEDYWKYMAAMDN
jgi:tetratricopeptide (TPR) repeat protein